MGSVLETSRKVVWSALRTGLHGASSGKGYGKEKLKRKSIILDNPHLHSNSTFQMRNNRTKGSEDVPSPTPQSSTPCLHFPQVTRKKEASPRERRKSEASYWRPISYLSHTNTTPSRQAPGPVGTIHVYILFSIRDSPHPPTWKVELGKDPRRFSSKFQILTLVLNFDSLLCPWRKMKALGESSKVADLFS